MFVGSFQHEEAYKNVCRKKAATPALPLHRGDVVSPQESSFIKNEESFLLYDSGSNDGKMLIFSMGRNILKQFHACFLNIHVIWVEEFH